MVEVGVLLPAVERFNGSGGAVATWAREVGTRSSFETVIAAPHASAEFAGHLRVLRLDTYDRLDDVLYWFARQVAFVSRRTAQGAYVRMLRGDHFWLGQSLAALGAVPVLHIHNRPLYAIEARRRGYRGKILLHMHNDLVDYIDVGQQERLWKSIDALAFCSDYLREQALLRYGDAVRDSVVIPNGVPAASISDVATQYDGRHLRLVFAGRLVPEKGVLEAIAICLALSTAGLGASLDIVGGTGSGSTHENTPYFRDVQRAVASANRAIGREAIRVLGPKLHPEVLDIFARSHVLLLPCRWNEPFGMVALEAMAKQCVPVVPRRGGLPDVVGNSGVIVDDRDGDRTADAFVEAIRRELLPRLDELANAAGKRARLMTWEAVAGDYDRVLERLV